MLRPMVSTTNNARQLHTMAEGAYPRATSESPTAPSNSSLGLPSGR